MSKSLSWQGPALLWPTVYSESPSWDFDIYVSKMVTYCQICSNALAADVGFVCGNLSNPNAPFNFAKQQLVYHLCQYITVKIVELVIPQVFTLPQSLPAHFDTAIHSNA